MLKIAVYC